MSFGPADASKEESLGMEAAQWLLRLDDSTLEAQFPDILARNNAFFDWISQSPDHLRVFIETVETYSRLALIDADRLIQVEQLLKQSLTNVVSLPTTLRKARIWTRTGTNDAPQSTLWRKHGALAAVLFCALSAGGFWWSKEAGSFTTTIGEQRMAKLDDGSFIYLNTDSRIEVRFSAESRRVRLAHGEALFVVESDSARPFIVTVGDATVRALGTQFNVRKHEAGADVAVVEGAVQVMARDVPQKLRAGEEAKVVDGRIAQNKQPAVQEALAWRQRRLIFHGARLDDVATEFNRYNRTKIRIEGDAAKSVKLSGIFDADRPQALMLYSAKNPKLKVEPEGSDWVIRGR